MANIPHKAPLPSCTSIDDVHGENCESAKTSENAGNDATDDDSFHHVLLPPFIMKNIYYKYLTNKSSSDIIQI